MSYDIQKVINIAKAEVGYLEKKSNSKLDNKTANAGKANYTKYWRDLASGMQGQPWCNCFVNWCFLKAYGEAAAKKLLCTDGGWSYYTPTSAGYFKTKRQWYTSKPQVGDIIYFKNATRIHHVGLVYKVDSSRVYTIEGNTSAGSAVVANGGGVAQKSYSLSSTSIAGYGRPNYGAQAAQAPATSTSYNKTQFIKDVQAAIGAKVDGIAGPETLKKTVTISKTKNHRHKVVLPIQKYLNTLGYNCGTPNGIAGVKFDAAVKTLQSKWMARPDGEITAKATTWKKLLGLA